MKFSSGFDRTQVIAHTVYKGLSVHFGVDIFYSTQFILFVIFV